MSKLPDKDFEKWIADHQAEIDRLLGSLDAAKTGGPVPAKKEAPPIPPARRSSRHPLGRVSLLRPRPLPTAQARSSRGDWGRRGQASCRRRRGRDSAGARRQGLGREPEPYNGLAGESAVQAHRLEAFTTALVGLKSRHAELLRLMRNADRTQEGLYSKGRSFQALHEMLQKAETFQQLAMQRVEEFDLIARQLTDVADRLYREAIASRMRPFADGVAGFPG